jgi:hypothetical protein
MGKKGDISKPVNCQNCNHQLGVHDDFCPACGQKALPEHLSLKYFLLEFLNNYFSFDSKFFNTVKPLLIKPAFLSMEFISGRRIRYINPIQLFIFSSFLFFLVNSVMILKEETDQGLVTISNGGNDKINVDSIKIEKADSLYIIRDGQETDTLDNSYVGEFVKRGQDFNALDAAARNEKVSKSFSYAVFLLLPLFALYLGWFFRQKKRHYLENIIFSLHFHAFYFIAGIFVLLFDRLLTGDIDNLILLTLVGIYLLVAVKRFYAFSWLSTVIRYLGLLVLYGVTVAVVLMASIVISLFI